MSSETTAPRWAAIRDDLRAKRAARAAARAMERDLANCSEAQRKELQAIASRYEGPDADAVREIINRRIA